MKVKGNGVSVTIRSNTRRKCYSDPIYFPTPFIFHLFSQPVVSDYENDVIKVSGEMVIQLAQALGSSADEILGLEKSARTNGPIKNRRLDRQLQNIEKLPKRDQQALFRTIDAFLAKAS